MSASTPSLRSDLPPIAGRSTKEWQAADAAHFLHPFTDHQALATKGVRVITRGEGIYVWDSEGQRILDAIAAGNGAEAQQAMQDHIEAATRRVGLRVEPAPFLQLPS